MARAAKVRTIHVCQQCGHQEAKWLGRCPDCGAWNTLVEEEQAAKSSALRRGGTTARGTRKANKPVTLADVSLSQDPRISTLIPELDRVLGGGLVEGSLVLVGGDPGIGKSTLLLQALGNLASSGQRVLYVTAEESLRQVKLRAKRLGIEAGALYLLAETNMSAVDKARKELKPDTLVIDSVQTVGVPEIESGPGSVSQIRAVTHELMNVAKGEGITTFVVGHVTKEGAIAGPKVMEHMVDTVLYFEGERTGNYRILRAHKNRFGSAQEIGVFEMHGEGLRPVTNPSELFLAQRAEGPGAAVVTSLEGSRPLLLEVQALTTSSPYGTPRRTTIGFDQQRVAMLSAVLERRGGIDMVGHDIYVNVAGGVRVTEPAADLGVVLALASAMRGQALPSQMVIVGEVGLSGEIRGVSQLAYRAHEAASLGFERCLVPRIDVERWSGPKPALPLEPAANIEEALDIVLG